MAAAVVAVAALLAAGAPAPPATAAPTATWHTVNPHRFGAVGDGRTDDTAALQRALDAMKAGDQLVIPAGKTYAHSGVLKIRRPGVRITGRGTLLATREATSSVWIAADNVTIDGRLILRIARTTTRWEEYEQMALRVGPYGGAVVSGLVVNGAAAAGIYVGGAHDFSIRDVVVRNTRADGIHMTEGAHDGQVINPLVINPGDDGVAVVSYEGGDLAHDILIQSPRLVGQRWGRAFSVVGGDMITWRDVYAENSSGAAVYIASEPSYSTLGSTRVQVFGGTLVGANQNPDVQQGAVLIYNGRENQINSDITIQGLRIRNSGPGAQAPVLLVSDDPSCVQQRVALADLLIYGGRLWLRNNSGASVVNSSNIVFNRVLQADRRGW